MSLISRLVGVATLSVLVAAPAVASAGGSGIVSGLRTFIPVQQTTAGKKGSARLSANWAGYAVASPDPAASPLAFTHVIGTWKVPAVTCGAGDSSSESTFWVGLGGFTGDTQVEQVGTWADCADQGPPSYFGWYELAPALGHSFALRIEPGDTMTASVSVTTTNNVTLTLKNVTRNKLAIAHVKVPVVDLSSAEWMAEAPSSCTGALSSSCTVDPIANFGSLAMSNVQATANGQTGTLTNPSWMAAPIEIGSSGSTPGTCTPTGIGTSGNAFSMSWAPAAADNC